MAKSLYAKSFSVSSTVDIITNSVFDNFKQLTFVISFILDINKSNVVTDDKSKLFPFITKVSVNKNVEKTPTENEVVNISKFISFTNE